MDVNLLFNLKGHVFDFFVQQRSTSVPTIYYNFVVHSRLHTKYIHHLLNIKVRLITDLLIWFICACNLPYEVFLKIFGHQEKCSFILQVKDLEHTTPWVSNTGNFANRCKGNSTFVFFLQLHLVMHRLVFVFSPMVIFVFFFCSCKTS